MVSNGNSKCCEFEMPHGLNLLEINKYFENFKKLLVLVKT